MARAVPGYAFPRMPERWSDSERQFGLALRNLFDTIFSDQETQDRNTAKNGELLKALDEKFTKATEQISNQLNEINDALADLDERIDETNERIDGLYDIIYPIGISVLWNDDETAPFEFGTWEIENIDPDTQEPVPDEYGHYMWRRVADPDDSD